MICKKCGLELRIKNTYTETEGDKSSDTVTRVYTVQDFICVNPNCEDFIKGGGSKTETVRHLIYEG